MPDSVYKTAFSDNFKVLNIKIENDLMIINLDILKMDFDSLVNLRYSVSKTIFENKSNINEIKFLDKGNLISDSNDYQFSFSSSMYRENEESNKSISRYIPDVPNPVIVIDPGHGGKYNHTEVTVNGILYKEKDVVLEIAKTVNANSIYFGIRKYWWGY